MIHKWMTGLGRTAIDSRTIKRGQRPTAPISRGLSSREEREREERAQRRDW